MTNNIPIGSPVRTQAIVNRYFAKAKKNLGQNFLVDQTAILGIVEAAGIKKMIKSLKLDQVLAL